jgi:glucose/arabinose dehydrogenase
MRLRAIQLVVGSIAAIGMPAGAAAVAGAAGPPPPKASNGHAVQLVATGLQTPTSFAFGAGQVFVGDGGSETAKVPGGGVFVLKGGTATRLAGSPEVVFGVVWHKNTLYVSAGPKLLAWSGWNGTRFASQKTIYTGPKNFDGFNGLAFGADGRLYAGVSDVVDHGPTHTPFARDLLSFTAAGKGLKVVASGIRQPWQLAFPAGSSSPFLSDLGQDAGSGGPNWPDAIERVLPGQDYGFPSCNWTAFSACTGAATPFKFLPPHSDAMGLAIAKGSLYFSEFGVGKGIPPQVDSIALSGGPTTPLLTGFVAPVVGLGTSGGYIYVGELTGEVFRVKP